MIKTKIFITTLITTFFISNCATISVITSLPGSQSDKTESQEKKKPLVYRQVVAHDYSKEDSFQLIYQWLSEQFVTSETYIDYINEDQGKIIGNTVIQVNNGKLKAPVKMIYIFEAKDNRFRITTKNFILGEYTVFWTLINEHVIEDKEELDVISEEVKKQVILPLCEYMTNSKSDQNW